MNIKQDAAHAVGNTPLIKLKKASELTGCTILGKAEFMNPGQSVKDRAALSIIRQAEKKGLLKKGGTIVEGTAGNTGIGLTVIGQALGYKSVIVIPETQSDEKKLAIRMLGAELIEVPAKPYKNPNNYIKYSERLAAHLSETLEDGVLWANQFDNTDNRLAHIEMTGPEVWEQTNGTIDGFACAVGTGGTLGGMSLALKEKNKDVQIAVADPFGSAIYNYFVNGELKSSGDSITEGIGQGRVTENLKDIVVDQGFQVSDTEALTLVYDLIQEEGLCLGGSSGINIAGAIKLAQEMGPGHTIVTILCDYGNRYASKIFNPEFLKQKNLPVPSWMSGQSGSEIPSVFID
ncbi:MAG: cysteine synthase A [Rhodomicrobiaceae bacterium]